MARLYAAARSGCGSLRPPIPPRGWRSRAFERWRLARRTPNERSGDGSPSRRTQVSLFHQRHAHVATTVFRSISGMTPPSTERRVGGGRQLLGAPLDGEPLSPFERRCSTSAPPRSRLTSAQPPLGDGGSALVERRSELRRQASHLWRPEQLTPPARSARRTRSELVAEFGGEVAAVERAEGRQGQMVLVEDLGDQSLDLLVLHAVDRGQHLVDGQEGPEVQLVLGQPVHAARGRLQRE